MADIETTPSVYDVLTSRHAAFSLQVIAEETDQDASAASLQLDALIASGNAFVLSDSKYLSDVAARRLEDTARRLIEAFHRKFPLKKGVPFSDIAAPLSKAAVVTNSEALISFLRDRNVVVLESEGRLRLPQHVVEMPALWKKPAEEIAAVYRSAEFDPPSPGNFQAHYPKDVIVVAIMEVLAETGELIRVSDRIYLHADTVARAKATLLALAKTREGITISGIRDGTGATRKIILPLLEYFVEQGITRRTGDLHELA